MFWAAKLKMLPDCASFSRVAATGALLKNAEIRAALAKMTNISQWEQFRTKCLNESGHFFNQYHTTQLITATGSGVTVMLILHIARCLGTFPALASVT